MDDQTFEPETAGSILAKNPAELHSTKTEIVVKRDWKEYIGESLLIIFSVVLALILTEIVNKANEKKQIRQLISNVREELDHNKTEVKKQYDYHLRVERRIDSALSNPTLAGRLVTNYEFHLEMIVDSGVLYGNIENIAWQLAKSRNIYSHLDIQTLSLLTSIYNDQDRIIKVEDEIGKIILSPESRKPENIRLTLILIRDNFRGWATYRVPDLLKKYDAALERLQKE